MSTFDDDARSIQDAQPAELYTITTPNGVYYLTSYTSDVTWQGNVYSAMTINRDNAVTPQSRTSRPLTVYVALTHALAQELLVAGVPQKDVRVQMGIYMFRSNTLRQLWDGHLTEILTDGVNLKLLVPSKMEDYFSVQLPIAVVQVPCQHALYDAGCTMTRTGPNIATTTVSSVSGTTIVVGAVCVNSAKYGEIVRLADNDRRSIVSQSGTTLVVDVPFRTLNPGDPIQVVAGCDHLVTTCRDTFGNVVNFGGNTLKPNVNIMGVWGRGALTSS